MYFRQRLTGRWASVFKNRECCFMRWGLWGVAIRFTAGFQLAGFSGILLNHDLYCFMSWFTPADATGFLFIQLVSYNELCPSGNW